MRALGSNRPKENPEFKSSFPYLWGFAAIIIASFIRPVMEHWPAVIIMGAIGGVFVGGIGSMFIDHFRKKYHTIEMQRKLHSMSNIEDTKKIAEVDIPYVEDEIGELEEANVHKIGALRMEISKARERLQTIRLGGGPPTIEERIKYGKGKTLDNDCVNCFFCDEVIRDESLVCIHCGNANAHNLSGIVANDSKLRFGSGGSDDVSSA